MTYESLEDAVLDDGDQPSPPLKAPFPYFGGKSRVASLVWDALGDVKNYVEPFAGSLAVLLARPHRPKIETVNDMDGLLANFWRAVAHAPDDVAAYADWPVNEADLEARHLWLVRRNDEIRNGLGDPEWFDAKAAGWWVWGICSWIGGEWCTGDGPWSHDGEKWINRSDGSAGRGIKRQRPHLGDAGMGINRKRPHLSNAGRGIKRQLPHLGDAGRGINRRLPHLGDAGHGIDRKRPHLGAGVGINRQQGVYDQMAALGERLRSVRVCCGDWSRVCGPSVTFKHGLTGVFLDPPYAHDNRDIVYNYDCGDVAKDVTVWALENGARKDMRIVVAGYEGEHGALTDAGWRMEKWKAQGGLGNLGQGQGRENKHRERLWFSPHCIPPEQGRLI